MIGYMPMPSNFLYDHAAYGLNAYGLKWMYEICSGIVRKVDDSKRLLYISTREISLVDIYSIQTGDHMT